MKIVKRIGVFETNSSSIHSVEILKKDIHDIFRDEKDIPEEQREIRTPLNKMLFVFGLLDHHLREFYTDKIGKSELKRIKNIKEIFINEYVKRFGEIDEETKKDIDIYEKRGYEGSFCLNFFNEDVLADCTCHYNNLEILIKELSDTEDYQSFAEYVFEPNVYFLLTEEWYGGIWYLEQKVF